MGEVLGFDGESFDPCRVEILRLEVLARIEYMIEGMVTNDPIKVFIKQEPHKISKLKDGRLRLISAVSIIDTMVDRMLFQRLFKAVVAAPMETPIAIGWTPLGSGAAFLKSRFPEATFDTDKKHWDWTFPLWLLEDCYSSLMQVMDAPGWWNRVAALRFISLYVKARFSFPDGTQVAQRSPGIQKSGCYLTLLLNSMGQWLLHEHAQIKLGVKVPYVCFGDDGTQRSTEFDGRFVDFYESLGFSVEAAVHKDIEFCGFHIYSGSRFLPAYRDKHVFLLEHLTTDREVCVQTLQSYQYIYWFDKDFLVFLRSIAKWKGLPEAIVSDDALGKVVLGR
nr:MAG: RNA-dependent RNA polymerase [Riboviria sp.]